MPVTARPAQPQIVEAYRDYTPPYNARRAVEMLLRHIPTENLIGLQSVVLTNSLSLSRDERRQKTWSRNRKVRLAECLGWYSGATRGSEATITILIDNLVRGKPRIELRVGFLRNMSLAGVLYHEVGRHIHEAVRPEFRGKEDVADVWKKKLTRKFARERYWYLFPVALPIKLVFDLKGDVLRLVRYVKRRFGMN
jgi:hypothetical protein